MSNNPLLYFFKKSVWSINLLKKTCHLLRIVFPLFLSIVPSSCSNSKKWYKAIPFIWFNLCFHDVIPLSLFYVVHNFLYGSYIQGHWVSVSQNRTNVIQSQFCIIAMDVKSMLSTLGCISCRDSIIISQIPFFKMYSCCSYNREQHICS